MGSFKLRKQVFRALCCSFRGPRKDRACSSVHQNAHCKKGENSGNTEHGRPPTSSPGAVQIPCIFLSFLRLVVRVLPSLPIHLAGTSAKKMGGQYVLQGANHKRQLTRTLSLPELPQMTLYTGARRRAGEQFWRVRTIHPPSLPLLQPTGTLQPPPHEGKQGVAQTCKLDPPLQLMQKYLFSAKEADRIWRLRRPAVKACLTWPHYLA